MAWVCCSDSSDEPAYVELEKGHEDRVFLDGRDEYEWSVDGGDDDDEEEEEEEEELPPKRAPIFAAALCVGLKFQQIWRMIHFLQLPGPASASAIHTKRMQSFSLSIVYDALPFSSSTIIPHYVRPRMLSKYLSRFLSLNSSLFLSIHLSLIPLSFSLFLFLSLFLSLFPLSVSLPLSPLSVIYWLSKEGGDLGS